MLELPTELIRKYKLTLDLKGIDVGKQPCFHRWLRFYLDFCRNYSVWPMDADSK